MKYAGDLVNDKFFSLSNYVSKTVIRVYRNFFVQANIPVYMIVQLVMLGIIILLPAVLFYGFWKLLMIGQNQTLIKKLNEQYDEELTVTWGDVLKDSNKTDDSEQSREYKYYP